MLFRHVTALLVEVVLVEDLSQREGGAGAGIASRRTDAILVTLPVLLPN